MKYNIKDIENQAVSALGFKELNAMQRDAIQRASTGKDITIVAPTGSGKTVAFLLPLWMKTGARLVLSPTRELAMQTADVWRRLKTGIPCEVLVGGHDLRTEQTRLQALNATDYLLVATPGRLKDHTERSNVDLARVQTLVIDEYDKCLELGFEAEMKWLENRLTGVKQRILTSATGNSDENENSNDKKTADGKLDLWQIKSPVNDKLQTLCELLLTTLSQDNESQAIVFVNYREAAERVAHRLEDEGITVALYHGALEQDHREKALIRLRGKSVRVMVSTDLAARGLDIPSVAHIIHYHLPQNEEAWVHRNGRTARAGASGNAYIILGPDEMLPEFVTQKLPFFKVSANKTTVEEAPFVTIYIGRGKKEKISKGDVVGFFTKNAGITGADLGRIDIQDHASYVAMRRDVADKALVKVKGLKIKGEKTIYLKVNS